MLALRKKHFRTGHHSTESALEGKRELNDDEKARLKQLWKKLVRMFHPDLHEHDPEKRKTYELLDRKSDDRIMDSRIIFEDGSVLWVMVPLTREGGIDVWRAGRSLLLFQ